MVPQAAAHGLGLLRRPAGPRAPAARRRGAGRGPTPPARRPPEPPRARLGSRWPATPAPSPATRGRPPAPGRRHGRSAPAGSHSASSTGRGQPRASARHEVVTPGAPLSATTAISTTAHPSPAASDGPPTGPCRSTCRGRPADAGASGRARCCVAGPGADGQQAQGDAAGRGCRGHRGGVGAVDGDRDQPRAGGVRRHRQHPASSTSTMPTGASGPEPSAAAGTCITSTRRSGCSSVAGSWPAVEREPHSDLSLHPAGVRGRPCRRAAAPRRGSGVVAVCPSRREASAPATALTPDPEISAAPRSSALITVPTGMSRAATTTCVRESPARYSAAPIAAPATISRTARTRRVLPARCPGPAQHRRAAGGAAGGGARALAADEDWGGAVCSPLPPFRRGGEALWSTGGR